MRSVVLTKDYLLYWEKQNRITVRNIVNLLNVKPVYGELLSDLHARVDSERLTVEFRNVVAKFERFKLTPQLNIEADVSFMGSLKENTPPSSDVVYHARGFLMGDRLNVVAIDVSLK